MPAAPRRTLILASSSRYRRELFARLGLSFRSVDPAVDETPRAGEHGVDLAQRLALDKALALAARYPAALIVGSDQTASLDGAVLRKPGSRAAALAQLTAVAGRELRFDTAVSVLDAATGSRRCALVPTVVEFKPLTAQEIAAYVDREPALDCLGAFKAEGLGIALCRRIESTDPTALIGLPLIALGELLGAFGVSPLSPGE